MKTALEKILLGAGLIAVLFGFSGCGTFETDTEALLAPPNLTEEQEKLNAALSEVAGTDYRLMYPSAGGQSSAFMFGDMDSDGTAEAIAFYSVDGENTRINLLKEEDGTWVSVFEAAGLSGSIESARFAKISGENITLIVKWEQEIGLFRLVGGKLERLHSSSCDGFDVADMNSDGFDDIILFSGSYIGRSVARILYETEGEIKLSSGTDISAQYSSIVSTVAGNLFSGHPAYFIDSKIYSGIYVTEVLTLEDNNVVCRDISDLLGTGNDVPGIVNESGVTVVSDRGNYARNSAVFCHDIDSDGIIEFPVESREDSASVDNGKNYFIKYYRFNGTEAQSVSFCIADEENGFIFDLPAEWEGLVSLSYSEQYGEYIVRSLSDSAEVLSLKISSLSDYTDIYEESYVLAAKSDTKAFSVRISAPEDSSFRLDPQSCEERITLI